MVERRKSKYDEEAPRIADALFQSRKNQIKDKDTFQIQLTKHFNQTELTPKQKSSGFVGKIFDEFRRLKPSVKSGSLFKEAGGKDLKRDQQTTAKRVTTSPKVYKQLGAQRSDLKGLDTKIVKGRNEKIIRKGKPVTILRDRRGRFIKRIK